MRHIEEERVAVLGCGEATSRGWGPTLARQGVNELVFADTDPAAARRMAQRFGGVAVDSLDAALAREPHAVVVATPLELLDEVALKALEAKASVMVESPMASSVRAAQTLVDAASGSPGMVLVAYHELLLLSEIFALSRDVLGAVARLAIVWQRAQPDEQLFRQAAPHAIAIAEKAVGGLAGASVRATRTDAGVLVRINRTGLDVALRFETGVELSEGERERVLLSVTGSGGTVKTLLPTRLALPATAVDYRPEVWRKGGSGVRRRAHLSELPAEDVIRDRQTRRWLSRRRDALPADLRFGLRVLGVVEAARASLTLRGTPVRLPAVD